MYKITLFALLLSNMVQAELTVKVRAGLSGDDLVSVALTLDKLGLTGTGAQHYDKKKFKTLVKQKLIDEKHLGYDYRLSKIVDLSLPETITDNTEIEIQCLKIQLYCSVEPAPSTSHSYKILYFPQLGLQIIVKDNDGLKKDEYDDFSELQNYEIFSFNHAQLPADEKPEHHDWSTWIKCPPGVGLNPGTVNFLDKIREMFEKNPDLLTGPLESLLQAIKLAGIPYDDRRLREEDPKAEERLAGLKTYLDSVIKPYLESVGLLPPLQPTSLK